MRRLCLGLLAAFVACGACGSSNSSPSAPSAPTIAVISVSVTPSPIIATASSNPAFQFQVNWTVTVTESAGLSGNLDFVNATLRNSTTGGEVGTINDGANAIIQRSGTNHILARGTLSVPQSVVYTLTGGGRQGTLTIAVHFTDDRGNVLTGSAQVNIV